MTVRRILGLMMLFSLGLLALMMVMSPDVAWARAGGGGGFGGGGGGGSGGGGSGGGGALVELLIYLCIHYPAIGIPLTLGILYLAFVGGKEGREGFRSHVIRREAIRQRAHTRELAVLKINDRDPDFREEHFHNRVSAAFLKIQEAWSQQEMSSARAFISDGIHERFSLQIKMQKTQGYRNDMKNVEVLDIETTAVYANDQFETIHVSIRAQAIDQDIDLKTDRVRRGSISSEEFTEIWSFHRRRGAQTLNRRGSLEGNCPNCAAPLEIQDRAECQACGSIVNSGEHDWVLAEITQVSEWNLPDPTRKVAGLAALKQMDPAFSVQHVEDRASVMFYRLNAAHFFGDKGYVEPILSQLTPEIPRLGNVEENHFWKNPAVGKVETLEVRESPDQQYNEVRVLVRWSGKLCAGEPAGKYRVIKPQAIYSHVYVLSRRRGIKSQPERTFSSSACLTCGAPIAVSNEENCSFCGTSLTDGVHDWVLTDIELYTHQQIYGRYQEDVERDLVAPQAETGLDPQLMLAVLARVVTSDGEVHDDEREALKRLAKHTRLTDADLELILQSALQKDLELPIPENPLEARECLRQIIHVCLTDGRFTKAEKQLVVDFANKLDYATADVKMMIAAEKRKLYQEARKLKRLRKVTDRNLAN